MGRSPSFDECLKPGQDLRRAYDSDADARRIVDVAQGLEGIVRNNSIHAAAVVIADRPLDEIVPAAARRGSRRPGARRARTAGPSARTRSSPSTRWARSRRSGLLKMDFLGLRNLDVIEDAVEIIQPLARGRGRDGVDPARRRQDLRDALPRRLGRRLPARVRGHARGAASRSARPSSTTSSRSARSTGRGRCASSPTTRAASAIPAAVTYQDPRLRPITEETYGCCIYQEQLMEIAKQIGGFSPAEADDLRKAVGKKKRDLMATMEGKFIEGCATSGTAPAVAKDLWSLMTAAADYCFNKSHAACYALISYRTAYLKANFTGRVHGGADLLGDVDQGQGPVLRQPLRGDGDRRAARPTSTPPTTASSSPATRSASASTRSRTSGFAAVQAIMRLARGRRAASTRSGTSASGSTRARSTSARSSAWSSAARSTPPAPRRGGCSRSWRRPSRPARRRRRTRRRGQGSIFDLSGGGAPDGSSNGVGSQRLPVPSEEFDQRELLRLEKETLGHLPLRASARRGPRRARGAGRLLAQRRRRQAGRHLGHRRRDRRRGEEGPHPQRRLRDVRQARRPRGAGRAVRPRRRRRGGRGRRARPGGRHPRAGSTTRGGATPASSSPRPRSSSPTPTSSPPRGPRRPRCAIPEQFTLRVNAAEFGPVAGRRAEGASSRDSPVESEVLIEMTTRDGPAAAAVRGRLQGEPVARAARAGARAARPAGDCGVDFFPWQPSSRESRPVSAGNAGPSATSSSSRAAVWRCVAATSTPTRTRSAGARFMGCVRKVFRAEINLDMFEAGRGRRRLRRDQDDRRPDAALPVRGRARLRGRRARRTPASTSASSTAPTQAPKASAPSTSATP